LICTYKLIGSWVSLYGLSNFYALYFFSTQFTSSFRCSSVANANMICIRTNAIGIRNVYINYFRFLFFFGDFEEASGVFASPSLVTLSAGPEVGGARPLAGLSDAVGIGEPIGRGDCCACGCDCAWALSCACACAAAYKAAAGVPGGGGPAIITGCTAGRSIFWPTLPYFCSLLALDAAVPS
jgi:hypothetical protein